MPKSHKLTAFWAIPAFGLGHVLVQELSWATYFTDIGGNTVGVFWLASGYVAGAMMLAPWRWWPAMLACVLASIMWTDIYLHGQKPEASLIWASSSLIEGLIAAGGMRLLIRRRPDLTLPADLVRFFAVILVATAVSAVIGSAIYITTFPGADFFGVWHVWWLSDTLGILALAPLMLVFDQPKSLIVLGRSPWRVAELAGLWVALGLVTLISIGPISLSVGSVLDYPYLILPILTLFAIRQPAVISLLATLMIVLVGVFSTKAGYGPFATHSPSLAATVYSLQAFMFVVLLMVLVLVVMMRQSRRLEKRSLQLRDQLFQSQRMEAVAQLARGVAHDVNNLLAVIQAHREQMSARVTEDPGLSDSLDAMAHASAQATALSRTLLDLGGHRETHIGQISLPSVVREAVRGYRQLLPANVQFEQTMPTAPPLYILADAGQVQQIVLNLIINARDALQPNGGLLRVAVYPDDDRKEVVLEVTDTGSGIAPEIKSRIFEPLFTTKPQGEGTGLGLSIVRSIVEAHGGTIRVESTLGKGTTFRVSFPAADNPARVNIPLRPTESGIIDLTTNPVCLLKVADLQIEGAIRAALVRRGWQVATVDPNLDLSKVPGSLCIVDAELLTEPQIRHAKRPTIVLGELSESVRIDDSMVYAIGKPFRISELANLAAIHKMG